MTLAKKNSRTIVVDDIKYRWLSSGNDDGIYIYAELAEEPRQLLCGRVDHDTGKDISVTPAYVEKMIRTGLSKGWIPDKSGSELKLYLL